MGFEGNVLLLTRIRCRNNPLNGRKVIDGKSVKVTLATNPKASYTAKKQGFRILCVSI